MKIHAPTAAATPVQKRVLYAASFILTSLVLRETYRSIINAMTSTILKITQCENVTNYVFQNLLYVKNYNILLIIYTWFPLGVLTLTSSPTFWPKTADPRGETVEILPSRGFASLASTN